MIKSVIQERGTVSFPVFNHEKHYMVPFMQKEGLPRELSHWQHTVDDMLDDIETDQPIYFMADQSFVHSGYPHRRPGVHVDGYWVPSLNAHEGGTHGPIHRPIPDRHRGYGRHRPLRFDGGGWSSADFREPEALILATNVRGSRAFVGEYDGKFLQDGGDASMVPLDDLGVLDLQSHRVYCGTVGTLHQSLPLNQSAYRTLVRLNCPGVSVQ